MYVTINVFYVCNFIIKVVKVLYRWFHKLVFKWFSFLPNFQTDHKYSNINCCLNQFLHDEIFPSYVEYLFENSVRFIEKCLSKFDILVLANFYGKWDKPEHNPDLDWKQFQIWDTKSDSVHFYWKVINIFTYFHLYLDNSILLMCWVL